MDKVSKDWLIGFIEGEGNFHVSLSKSYRSKNYLFEYYPILQFRIFLRSDDLEVLEKIKKTLEIGKIYNKNYSYSRIKGVNAQDQCCFYITSSTELKIFEKFLKNAHFHSKKKNDMINFFKILNLKISKKHLKIQGNQQIVNIALGMNSKNRSNFRVKRLTE